MTNYLKSEYYRIIRRKNLLVLFTVIILSGPLANVIFAIGREIEPYTFKNATAVYSVNSIGRLIIAAFFFGTIILADLIFADEYRNGTMKNTVSCGISRWQVMAGKIIVLLSFVIPLYVLSLIAEYSTAACFLRKPDDFSLMSELFMKIAFAAFPLIIYAGIFSLILCFAIKNVVGKYIVFICSMWLVPYILQGILSSFFNGINQILPCFAYVRMMDLLSRYIPFDAYTSDILAICLSSLGKAVVILVVGGMIFYKKEIK